MYSAQWNVFLAIIPALIASKLLVVFIRTCWRRKVMPPGPRGLPLLGNIFQIPKKELWWKFMDWNREYGPIFSLNLAGQPVVVLNSYEAVAELLDRRSSIYSDRPDVPMASEVLCGGLNFGFMPYGNLWRKFRRAVHSSFNVHAVKLFEPVQTREAISMVSSILNDTNLWENSLKRFGASAILCTTYDWSLYDSSLGLSVEEKDREVEKINSFVSVQSQAVVPGKYLVNSIPALLRVPAWFSGAGWKREGLKKNDWWSKKFLDLVGDVRSTVKEGRVGHCLAANLIENEEKFGLEKIETAWLAGVMFGAGSDTTSSLICFLVLAMTHYPDVLCNAHSELDSVVGRDRTPTFEDRSELPYIEAIIKELFRWRPAAPLATPRKCTQDDWYQGYLIPKGTTIFENIWAISHDPSVFTDPQEFRPSRFLNSEEKGKSEPSTVDESDHKHQSNADKVFAFGFGRRICPGQHLANNSLFIAISMPVISHEQSTKRGTRSSPILMHS